MPRSSRRAIKASELYKSEQRHGPQGRVYMSIAPIGRWYGRTQRGLSEVIPDARDRLLSQEEQRKLSAALSEKSKKVYESTPTSA
jgi:hypothetical protein